MVRNHQINNLMKKLLSVLILATMAFSVLATEQFNIRKDIITIVVPQGPGPANTLCLKLGQLMKEKGVTVLVVNKPGANKTIGTNFVANSEPDGRTLLVTSAADMALLPQVMPEVAKFNRTSFVPVMSLAGATPVIAVRSNFPANNFKEFLDVIKKDTLQRQISMYSSNTKLIASAVYSLVGASPEIISYNSEDQALTDVASGNLQAGIFTANERLRAMAATGKIKVLVSLTDKRDIRFQNIESISETYPNTKFQYWWGLYAPADTPKSTIQELHQAFSEVWTDPRVVAEIDMLNLHKAEMTLPMLNTYLDSTYKNLDLLASKYLK